MMAWMAITTRYVCNGDVNLAYQIHGDGPIDLILVNAFISHVEHVWENPGFARFLTRLTQFSRLIIWDRRGSGLSDDGPLGLEHEVDDVNAVLDAAGSERAAVLAYNAGGPLAALHAARFPTASARSCSTAACCTPSATTTCRGSRAPRSAGGASAGSIERWGEGTNLAVLAPTAAGDPLLQAWLARLERLAASPGQARRLVAAAEAATCGRRSRRSARRRSSCTAPTS